MLCRPAYILFCTIVMAVGYNASAQSVLSRYIASQSKSGTAGRDTVIDNYIFKWENTSKSSKLTIDSISKNDFKVVTIQGDTLNCISPHRKRTLIVFANSYSCLSCFAAIEQWWQKSHPDTSRVDLFVLGRMGEETSGKRNLINSIHSQIPSNSRYYFDIQKVDDDFDLKLCKDGLFKKFGISITPSVMIWNNETGKVACLISYHELIDASGAMKDSAKNLLDRFLIF